MASIAIRVPSGEIENARETSGGAYVTPAGNGHRESHEACRRLRLRAQQCECCDRCECGGGKPRNSHASSHRIDCRDAGAADGNPLRGFGDVIAQLRQIAREVAGRGVALIRILGEATLDDPAQLRRENPELGDCSGSGSSRMTAASVSAVVLREKGRVGRGHLVETAPSEN